MIPDLEFDCETCQIEAETVVDAFQQAGEPTSATMEQGRAGQPVPVLPRTAAPAGTSGDAAGDDPERGLPAPRLPDMLQRV